MVHIFELVFKVFILFLTQMYIRTKDALIIKYLQMTNIEKQCRDTKKNNQVTPS